MNPWPVDAGSRRSICLGPVTPTWWEHRSTGSPMCATSSSGPAPGRPRPGWQVGRWPRLSCAALGVKVYSHVIQITARGGPAPRRPHPKDFAAVDDSPVRCLDPEASRAWSPRSIALRKANESLGGVFEVRAFGLVPGLGSHVSWEERLDGRLGQAILSIQAMKAVSIGDGFEVAGVPGSQAHDEIFCDEERGYTVRPTVPGASRAG